eukprot:TRINITY_DN69_c0_g1_i1.p3 TRINITY_DN69_c0_g1~~TRINITY_DN69_c0_g1_i1.p3  ORF type:complete len:120 (+),score=4.87 TRINITY_DN69_c0_g1_i1:139-498(+)
MVYQFSIMKPSLRINKCTTFSSPKASISNNNRASRIPRASEQKAPKHYVKSYNNAQIISLPSGVFCGLLTMASVPMMAEAAVTPSLQNLLYSVFAGGIIAAIIASSITFVATFDPVNRK